jgi:hypothetical protein
MKRRDGKDAAGDGVALCGQAAGRTGSVQCCWVDCTRLHCTCILLQAGLPASHPVATLPGSFKSHGNAQVAGLCGPLCRCSRTRQWRWARPAVVAVRVWGAGDLRRVDVCAGMLALATGRLDDARADDTG